MSERELYWRELVDRYLASGKTQIEFSQSEGVKTNRLNYWLRKFRGVAEEVGASGVRKKSEEFYELGNAVDLYKREAVRKEAKQKEGMQVMGFGGAELLLPNGMVLRVWG